MMTMARPACAPTRTELLRLMSLMTGDEKHSESATSTLDVVATLYERVLRVSPSTVDDPGRDRFLLSKGHGPMAYYPVLVAHGFFGEEELCSSGRAGSGLGQHPDRLLVPGVEISSGSLGHGLPIALGIALGLRAQGRTEPRVVCLIGDAELDEGSNAEAIVAAAALGADALSVVIVDNSSSSLGWPGGIVRRFAVEGWHALTVDGRNQEEIAAAFSNELHPRDGRPQVVVAVVDPGQ